MAKDKAPFTIEHIRLFRHEAEHCPLFIVQMLIDMDDYGEEYTDVDFQEELAYQFADHGLSPGEISSLFEYFDLEHMG